MIFVRMYPLFFNMCGGTGTKVHPKRHKNEYIQCRNAMNGLALVCVVYRHVNKDGAIWEGTCWVYFLAANTHRRLIASQSSIIIISIYMLNNYIGIFNVITILISHQCNDYMQTLLPGTFVFVLKIPLANIPCRNSFPVQDTFQLPSFWQANHGDEHQYIA